MQICSYQVVIFSVGYRLYTTLQFAIHSRTCLQRWGVLRHVCLLDTFAVLSTKSQTGHMKIPWTRPQIWGPEFGPPETISYVPEGRILTPKLGFTFWVIFRVQRCSFRFGPPALPINARRTIMYHGYRRVCKCGYMYSKPSGGQFTMTWLRCPKLQQTSGHSGEVALMCIRCMHAFTKSTLHV